MQTSFFQNIENSGTMPGKPLWDYNRASTISIKIRNISTCSRRDQIVLRLQFLRRSSKLSLVSNEIDMQ